MRVGVELLGLTTEQIQGIFPAISLSRFPSRIEAILGLGVLRGETVSAYSLESLLRLS